MGRMSIYVIATSKLAFSGNLVLKNGSTASRWLNVLPNGPSRVASQVPMQALSFAPLCRAFKTGTPLTPILHYICKLEVRVKQKGGHRTSQHPPFCLSLALQQFTQASLSAGDCDSFWTYRCLSRHADSKYAVFYAGRKIFAINIFWKSKAP